ncbi:MAG: amino acid-binding protein [Lachnospiraceae bacterium]|nr:amino acid-binding protein [Lachnospiraceae bacterium]
MYMKQLTVFLENREGRLESVTELLANNNINVACLALADTSEYGVLRLIVSRPDEAKVLLKDAGYSSRLTEVLAVRLEQTPGTVSRLTKVLAAAGINIEYMYTLSSSKEFGSMILKVSDIEKAAAAVSEAGMKLVDPEAAYSL